MIKLKDKYKTEWRNFWKNPNIPEITKIYYGIEFETARDFYIKDYRLYF